MKTGETTTKKRMLSGVKPTGTGNPHIGNYFGAIKQFVDMQNSGEYESFIFIANLHALNQVHDAKVLAHNTLELAKTYLACGIDPEKVNLFRQSDIREVTELCWIFNSIAPMSMMLLAHAYKDATSKGENVNVGLFDYPVLMAADILIYGSDIVPVGQDQKQHVEIAREIARIFNNLYSDASKVGTGGETFKYPKEKIVAENAIIKGLDGRKMSKSYGNGIGLFGSEKDTIKKVMSIVTDSRKPDEPKDPETCNIFYFHKLFSDKKQLEELAIRYKEGKISYKESKDILAENINNFLRPIRDKKKELDNNEKYVLEVLEKGAIRARELAKAKMEEVREKVGLNITR